MTTGIDSGVPDGSRIVKVEVGFAARFGADDDFAVGVSTMADCGAAVALAAGFAVGTAIVAVLGVAAGETRFEVAAGAGVAVVAESESSSAGSGARFGTALTGSSWNFGGGRA